MTIKNYFRKKLFEHQLEKFSFPVKIIVGADGERLPGWLSTEKDFFDVTAEDDWKKYFDIRIPKDTSGQFKKLGHKEEIIDGVKTMVPVLETIKGIPEQKTEIISHILCEEVLNFLDASEIKAFLRLAYKYLIPGGRIRISVPDNNHPSKEYRDKIIKETNSCFDYKVLIDLLREAGFKKPMVREGYIEGNMFNISTWYMSDGLVKRSFWYDPKNIEVLDGFLWTSLIVDGIKQ